MTKTAPRFARPPRRTKKGSMRTQMAFHFDAAACSGCKTCMVACMDGRDTPASALWRRVAEYAGGEWSHLGDEIYTQNIFSYYMSVSCNHCLNPACVQVCPTKAMARDGHGVVSVDQKQCAGCRRCERACPYSAPQYDARRRAMTKCDFCRERLLKGESPLCVAACPMRALDFGEYEDLKRRYGDAAHVAPLPDQGMTRPCLVLAPPRNARPVGSREGVVGNPEEI